jgi:RNA polymerase sigma-70 factor (ECF subfamily)
MNRYEGKTYGEIAETLHVSVRTIEVRMGKALAFLRENLKDYLITAFIFAGIFSA